MTAADCQFSQRIEIDMLADNLNMEPAEAEKWVVNMIRLAHLDAKIDSKFWVAIKHARYLQLHSYEFGTRTLVYFR